MTKGQIGVLLTAFGFALFFPGLTIQPLMYLAVLLTLVGIVMIIVNM